MAVVRCRRAGVLGDSCQAARTPPLPAEICIDEAWPALRERMLACAMDVDGMRATVHEHVPNTY